MVRHIREAVQIRGRVNYELTESEKASTVFRRSIFAVRDIREGEVFTEENVRVIRPSYGIEPKEYKDLLGKHSKQNYKAGEPLQQSGK